MFIIAISGTARNAPTNHHILDQKTKASNITKLLRFNLFPIIFGSNIFPEINCGTNIHTRRTKGVKLESKTVKLYRNGSVSAIIPPTAGIKSKRNTRSANIRAYSRPKKNMMIQLTPALRRARKNFERKNRFIS